MSAKLVASTVGILGAVATLMARLVAAQQPTLDQTLTAAAAYVEVFPAAAAGVVLEEAYSQQLRSNTVTARHLRSDVLIMPDADNGWLEFRDVFEVDGKPVRDRTDRLASLFMQPLAGVGQQARRIVADGTRFNLDAVIEGRRVSRTLNMPTVAMWFLRASNQRRSSFSRRGVASVGNRRAAVVDFKETAKPRVIRTNSDAAARGTLWIDIDTGALLRSELELANVRDQIRSDGTIRVEYELDAGSRLFLPHSMDEHYEISADASADLPVNPTVQSKPNPSLVTTSIMVEGQATYANVRHFNVTVETQPGR